MRRFLVKRLLYCIPVLFGISLLTFLLFRVVGGDPVDRLAGKYARAEQKEQLREQLGFNLPLWPRPELLLAGDLGNFADNQLFHHLFDTFTFRFGRSQQYHRRISAMILSGLVPSLSLTLPAFLLGLFLQTALALLSASRRGSRFDRLLTLACLVGMSFPFLALIIFGQSLLAGRFGWFPILGFPEKFGLGVLTHTALPVLLGLVAGLGGGVRFYRTILIEEAESDYVRTARAKGLKESRVLFGHVLKNAMIPIITRTVVVIPFLFLGSLLLERFFSIPGLGYMLVDAVNSSDWPVINALTFVGAVFYLGAVVLTDVLYALVDPRVSLK